MNIEREDFIPVYQPDLSGNEKKYVNECLDTRWISSIGRFVADFEEGMAHQLGVAHAIAVSNGTVALHLALHCLDVGPGDEVIVPTFTYIASVNTIAQTGATPVFVECRIDDWLVSVDDVESKITPKTKAIMAVHLYGAICDMDSLRECAERHGIALIEDCAEALGSTLNGRFCGGLGHVGTFSFFGNKTLTTGEGGLVTTDDDALAERMRRVKGQGQSARKRYWHVELGFNYRMTNICAAIGLAQLERLDDILARKRSIAAIYRHELADIPVDFQRPAAGVNSSEWLFSVLLPKESDREAVMQSLLSEGVETRPVFYCAHQLPMYEQKAIYPVSEDISRRGISLPSYPALTDEQVVRVAKSLAKALGK
jgi:perosamine synthetase